MIKKLVAAVSVLWIVGLAASDVPAADSGRRIQLAQQNDPFGSFLGGLLGVPQNQNQNKGQPSGGRVVPGGDPIANALRQLDVAKDIKAKADSLEQSVANVIYTVKLYQALNGGIWYKLGVQLNDLYKLDADASEGYVKQFIAQTQTKRVAGQNALKFVEINAVDDIKGQNQTISNNNYKVAVLRKSVSAYVNAIGTKQTFESLVANQNIPLDAMMQAYLVRVADVTATMESAGRVFGGMSSAYEGAVVEMDGAIKHFESQSGLVATEIAKQIGILALEVANMKNAIDNARNNPFAAIMVLAQGVQIISDLSSMEKTLSAFNETKDWFDQNSIEILNGSRGARAELLESVSAIQSMRPMLTASWKRNCGAVSKAAATMRKETVKFESELAEMQQQGMQKAPAMEKNEMDELDSLLKKPRRLKS